MWWIAGAALVLFLLFLYQLLGPNPPIIVSRQTTYITAPLLRNGLPDYEKYWLQHFGKDVTHENNAAVLLYPAMGPGDISPGDYRLITRELGIDDTAAGRSYLEEVHGPANRKRVAAWLNDQGRLKLPGRNVSKQTIEQVLNMAPMPLSDESEQLVFDVVDFEIDRAMFRPWSAKQLPPLETWVADNSESLDLIVDATKRPHWFSASGSMLNNEPEPLSSMLLVDIMAFREAARALSLRAMQRIGEDRLDESWQDLLAIHRLACFLGQGNTLVAELVGIAISGIACDATLTLLGQANLTVEQAKQIQSDLLALPNFSMARALEGERLWAIDGILRYSKEGLVALQDDTEAAIYKMMDALSIDWNVVLQYSNRIFDQLTAAMACPTRELRITNISQIEADLDQTYQSLLTPSKLVGGALSRQVRSDLLAAQVAAFFMPACQALANAQDRGNTVLDLTRVAAALAVFRAQHGSYPQHLTDLIPGSADSLSSDLYTQRPLIYRQLPDGYLLYSAGENRRDEGGNNEAMSIFEGQRLEDLPASEAAQLSIPPESDDFSIRLPRLPLNPPSQQASPVAAP